jgi:CBS-domain-containing membrane protein
MMKVRDMMTAEVVTVGPQTPLKHVANLLVEHGISGLPVVDDAGSVVGVVSEADFLEKEGAEGAPRTGFPWVEFFSGKHQTAQIQRAGARLAGEAMTSPAMTIRPDEPLRHAAAIMSRRLVDRLPVVEDGRLVGIITRADLVRVFARTDDELRQQVIKALRAVDGLTVVGVRDGVVELAGTVQSEALMAAVRSLVEHLDGVVGVEDRNVAWVQEPAGIPL